MTTEIWREIDPNLDLPVELKNVKYVVPAEELDVPDPEAVIDIQEETLSDDDSELDEPFIEQELDAPSSLTIVSQTVRTAPDGRQVVDIVIEVEDIPGALNYELRVTK